MATSVQLDKDLAALIPKLASGFQITIPHVGTVKDGRGQPSNIAYVIAGSGSMGQTEMRGFTQCNINVLAKLYKESPEACVYFVADFRKATLPITMAFAAGLFSKISEEVRSPNLYSMFLTDFTHHVPLQTLGIGLATRLANMAKSKQKWHHFEVTSVPNPEAGLSRVAELSALTKK